jgi:hypothetical protein
VLLSVDARPVFEVLVKHSLKYTLGIEDDVTKEMGIFVFGGAFYEHVV